MATKNYDLFVSYADADSEWVEGYLLDALQQAGVNYCSEETFTLGAVRIEEFERAIRESERTLLILSGAYLADTENRFVNSLAQHFGFDTSTWPVIPLYLESELKVPTQLRVLVGLDATAPEKWEKVIERLCKDLDTATPKEAKIPECPYPGMRPFSENDEGRFFGRDGEIDELLNRLRLEPFLTVIGASGSGKSSLVFAGLIPKLKQSGLFGTGQWCIRSFRPGTSPLANLQAVLGGDVTALEVRIQQLLSTESDAQRLLLVVDQFEELFTQGGAEATTFQETLLRLMEIPNVYLILTVRADFYPDLMGSLLWEKIRFHRFEVLPLDEKGLRQAIVRPAKGVEVYVDSPLVERLLVDAKGEPGVLPLIQETLVLLWEKLKRRFLPLRAYERTGLQAAIAYRADAALANLETEAKQVIARRIFLRLIQFGEGRPDTRRQQLEDALQSVGDDLTVFRQTLEYLATRRLLTFSGEKDSQHRKVDIAHEALIAGWPTLQEWISKRREAEQIRRRLDAKVQEWVRLGQGKGGLLDEVELAEAERWLSSLDAKELGVSQNLPDLVEASRKVIDDQLENAKKTARELRKRLYLATSLAIVSVIAAIGAMIGFSQALQQTRLANLRRLTAQPFIYSENQLDVALLLSLEALDRAKKNIAKAETLEARSNLFKILQVNSRLSAYLHGDLHGHSQELRSVALSPNGRRLASASGDAILLWDVITRELIAKLPLTDAQAIGLTDRGIVFNHDGTKLAYGRDDGSIIVLDLSQQEKPLNNPSCTLPPYPKDPEAHTRDPRHDGTMISVRSLAFNPVTPNKLVSGGFDGKLILWDVAQCKRIATYLDHHKKPVNSVAFSTNGKLLASGGNHNKMILWDVRENSLQQQGCKTKDYNPFIWISSLAFDPTNEMRLAVGSSDHNIHLWDLKECKPKILRGHNSWVNSIAFNQDGSKVASGSQDGTVIVWDVKTLQPISEPLIGHNGEVQDVAFNPQDPDQLFSAGYDRDIILWDLKAPSRFGKTLPDNEGEVSSVDISRDNKWLASGSAQQTCNPKNHKFCPGKIFLWKWQDSQGWQLQREPLDPLENQGNQPKDGRIWSVAFNPDGTILASGDANNTVILWDVINHKLLRRLNQHFDHVTSVAFSLEGKKLGSVDAVDRGGTLNLWDVTNPETQIPLLSERRNESFRSVAFSPDNKWLATGSWHDGVVRLWKIVKNEEQEGWEEILLPQDSNIELVNSVAFSPDSKILAAGGFRHFLYLWDVETRALLVRQLIAHRDSINSVAFSRDPNGEILLASGSNDGNIILWVWDSANRRLEQLAKWRGHNDAVKSMVFSWDNKTLVSGGKDGKIKIWDVSLDKWQEISCRMANRNLTSGEWKELISPYTKQPRQSICPNLHLP